MYFGSMTELDTIIFITLFCPYFLGNDERCCQIHNPLDQKESRRCGIGEGHCDYDEDCMEGLVCGSCNCPGDDTTGANCADCCTLQSIHDQNLRLTGKEIDYEGLPTDFTIPGLDITIPIGGRNDVP